MGIEESNSASRKLAPTTQIWAFIRLIDFAPMTKALDLLLKKTQKAAQLERFGC
jgi:hypothetical protein